MPPLWNLQELCLAPSQANVLPYPTLALLGPLALLPLPLLLPLMASALSLTILAPLIIDSAIALKADFSAYFVVGLTFYSTLDSQNNKLSISHYQAHMEKFIDGIKAICCSCGMFVFESTSTTFNQSHPLLSNSLTSGFLNNYYLDYCSINNSSFCFWKICIKSLKCNKPPKYEFTNAFPQINCQSYPNVLERLSMAKETAIVCAHPVVLIDHQKAAIKKRPSRNGYQETAIKKRPSRSGHRGATIKEWGDWKAKPLWLS